MGEAGGTILRRPCIDSLKKRLNRQLFTVFITSQLYNQKVEPLSRQACQVEVKSNYEAEAINLALRTSSGMLTEVMDGCRSTHTKTQLYLK